MALVRIPEGENWKDYAVPCPSCDEPVLAEYEHYNRPTLIDPGWWKCDAKTEAENAPN